MRIITLTEPERTTLEEGCKNHTKFHVRTRFQAMLWSDEGYKVKAIAALCKVRARTIYTWMNRWEEIGFLGLYIARGRGLKPTLKITDSKVVEEVKKKHKCSAEV